MGGSNRREITVDMLLYLSILVYLDLVFLTIDLVLLVNEENQCDDFTAKVNKSAYKFR